MGADEDVEHVAAALEKNSTVTSLDLGGNTIGDKGAESIVAALEQNRTVTAVDLNHNNIGAQGAMGIAATLEKNPMGQPFTSTTTGLVPWALSGLLWLWETGAR